MSNNGPVNKFRIGSVTATVWKREFVNSVGNDQIGFSISLEKSWKDKESDEWKKSSVSFFLDDCPKAIACLRRAWESCSLSVGVDSKSAPVSEQQHKPDVDEVNI